MAYGCYTDSSGCLVCPAIPASAGTPPKITYSPALGWNASADSSMALDGDLHVVFSIEKLPVGALCGFRNASTIAVAAAPVLLAYAFMARSVSAHLHFEIYENGKLVNAPVLAQMSGMYAAPGDTLEIRRQRQIVTYWYTSQNAAQPQRKLVYTSNTGSVGPLVVSACLYASGDAIG